MLEIYNNKLVSYGLQPETRLFAHGQGYDLVERPAFFKGETMKVKENMFLRSILKSIPEKHLVIIVISIWSQKTVQSE